MSLLDVSSFELPNNQTLLLASDEFRAASQAVFRLLACSSARTAVYLSSSHDFHGFATIILHRRSSRLCTQPAYHAFPMLNIHAGAGINSNSPHLVKTISYHHCTINLTAIIM